jgi:hypothetical protein
MGGNAPGELQPSGDGKVKSQISKRTKSLNENNEVDENQPRCLMTNPQKGNGKGNQNSRSGNTVKGTKGV